MTKVSEVRSELRRMALMKVAQLLQQPLPQVARPAVTQQAVMPPQVGQQRGGVRLIARNPPIQPAYSGRNYYTQPPKTQAEFDAIPKEWWNHTDTNPSLRNMRIPAWLTQGMMGKLPGAKPGGGVWGSFSTRQSGTAK